MILGEHALTAPSENDSEARPPTRDQLFKIARAHPDLAHFGNVKVAKLVRRFLTSNSKISFTTYIAIKYRDPEDRDPTGELAVHRILHGITTEI